MSHRRDQKERLRREREERERQKRDADKRKKMLGYGLGGALAVAALVFPALFQLIHIVNNHPGWRSGTGSTRNGKIVSRLF